MHKITEHPVLVTLFGATGDLASRKLFPALFRLYQRGHLKKQFAVIGTARREWNDDYFRQVVRESLESLDSHAEDVDEFVSHFYYLAHNVTDSSNYVALKQLADTLDERYQLQGNRLFYLAMAPTFFGVIAQELKAQNLMSENGYSRLIIEKPFGHDLESAIQLNDQLAATFDENQIYRIDHYLGKEMVQNINPLRFSNILFSDLWNNRYIDNIQITLAEEVGVEERAGYYDQSGALRDMVQNHIFQILSLLIMEPPVTMNGEDVRIEKIKALRSLHFYDANEARQNFVRAQYTADGERLGYLQEKDIAENSRTETFVAGKIMVDNFRWKGVPFYVRTGKRLSSKDTVIHIQFKPLAINLFESVSGKPLLPNVLTIHIQPSQGMALHMNVKQIGFSNQIKPYQLLNYFTPRQERHIPEAYERLILECLNGNNANFAHREEVELSWRFIDSIRSAWDADTSSAIPTYISGTMGPKESDDLLSKDGFYWYACDDITEM